MLFVKSAETSEGKIHVINEKETGSDLGFGYICRTFCNEHIIAYYKIEALDETRKRICKECLNKTSNILLKNSDMYFTNGLL